MRAFRRNVIPYCPMGPKRKEVSIDEMNAILAKRSRAKPNEGTTPAERATPRDSTLLAERVIERESARRVERVILSESTMTEELQWNTPSLNSYAVTTLCGRYSCCKVWVMGKTQYEVWSLDERGNFAHPVAVKLGSFTEAKERAAEHLRAKKP